MTSNSGLIQKPVSTVSLLLVRNSKGAALEKRLENIANRYGITLSTYAPDALPEKFSQFSKHTPTVLVLRNGKIVSETIGDFFPTQELDRVVRRAVEWTT